MSDNLSKVPDNKKNDLGERYQKWNKRAYRENKSNEKKSMQINKLLNDFFENLDRFLEAINSLRVKPIMIKCSCLVISVYRYERGFWDVLDKSDFNSCDLTKNNEYLKTVQSFAEKYDSLLTVLSSYNFLNSIDDYTFGMPFSNDSIYAINIHLNNIQQSEYHIREYLKDVNLNEYHEYAHPEIQSMHFLTWLLNVAEDLGVAKNDIYIYDKIKKAFFYMYREKYLYNSASQINTLSNIQNQIDDRFKKNFSMLMAIIFKKPSNYLKPIVIFADKSMQYNIVLLLNWFNCSINYTCTFSSFKYQKTTVKLMLDNLNDVKAYIFNNCSFPQTEEGINRLKKLMNGKRINIKLNRSGKSVYFKNTIPFIYITDNQKNYQRMKNAFGAVEIHIPNESTDYFYDFKNFSCVYQYIQLGFYYLRSGKLSKTKTKISSDEVFKKFVDKCCILNANAECTKRELHEAYVEFYKNTYGGEPLELITFSKKIALFANLKPTRPHKSRKSYPTYFKGIKLKVNKSGYTENHNL